MGHILVTGGLEFIGSHMVDTFLEAGDRETADIGPMCAQVLRVAPGITGLCQVEGCSKASFSERVTD